MDLGRKKVPILISVVIFFSRKEELLKETVRKNRFLHSRDRGLTSQVFSSPKTVVSENDSQPNLSVSLLEPAISLGQATRNKSAQISLKNSMLVKY